MSLTEANEIPPIFDNLFQQLKERKKIPHDEFKCMLFGLRIQKEDLDKLEKWFIKKGILSRVTSGEEKKTRKDYVIFCFFNDK